MFQPSTHKISRPVAVAGQVPWVVALSIWAGAGCVAVICFPPMRSIDPWFGWLPFWLVVAPLIDLIVLRHRRLAARTVTWWTCSRQRRRPARNQARRWHRRPMHSRTSRSARGQDD